VRYLLNEMKRMEAWKIPVSSEMIWARTFDALDAGSLWAYGRNLHTPCADAKRNGGRTATVKSSIGGCGMGA
jgi:hypothetical protein